MGDKVMKVLGAGPTAESLPEMELPAITEEEAVEAAQAAGLELVDIKRVKHYKKLGQFLAKQGLIPISRGKMLARSQALERAREKMVAMLDHQYIDMTRDPEDCPPIEQTTAEVVISVAQTIGELVKVENAATELDLKLEGLAREQASKVAIANSTPPPGASVQLTGTIELRPPKEKPIVVNSAPS